MKSGTAHLYIERERLDYVVIVVIDVMMESGSGSRKGNW